MSPEKAYPGATILICKCCCEAISEHDQFCQHCGFPLKATEEQQQGFIYHRGYKKNELKELDNKIAYAAITLYFISGLLLLSGLVLFFLNTQNNFGVSFLITDGILAILFFCLGAWSYKKPIAAIICALTLYIVVVIVQGGLSNSILIKILIIVALIRALINAFKAERIRKQYNI